MPGSSCARRSTTGQRSSAARSIRMTCRKSSPSSINLTRISISSSPAAAFAKPSPRPASWGSRIVDEADSLQDEATNSMSSPLPPALPGGEGREEESLCEIQAWSVLLAVEEAALDVSFPIDTAALSRFERPLTVAIREARLLNDAPWIRSLGKLGLDVATEGWKFPAPPVDGAPPALPPPQPRPQTTPGDATPPKRTTRPLPTGETVMIKDRLLYLLQPPLENLFAGKQVQVPFKPFPYQLEGIAFLMPRHAALLADEMGLGKTIQTLLSLRLLFHAGLVRRALIVCPKPIV